MRANVLYSIVGVIGGFIATMFGGWSEALITLIIFMSVDYVTGIIVAGIFKKSKKSESGALESRAGFKGLCRKGAALMIVLVAVRLDIVMQTSYIKDAVIIAFIANESISIIENAGLMGIPIPSVISKAIDTLKSSADSTKTEA
ncbi:phage holin family protein [Lachnoanaerobaculum sp. Marseille-Q4761]|uniref:phage holin family protein n=1 Tax=Lachnoanaerobaculum sp. Marseille-Q4761 TaxID=2819511 RepID=UPI001AA19C4D|nr:phage holin family protein [Lachnoanaerobaculum sp. Marseille-Q4761]MBO1870062.1 phage holin family protein [Lachnoanaerobaculum sp. Marseille-Q4761]